MTAASDIRATARKLGVEHLLDHIDEPTSIRPAALRASVAGPSRGPGGSSVTRASSVLPCGSGAVNSRAHIVALGLAYVEQRLAALDRKAAAPRSRPDGGRP